MALTTKQRQDFNAAWKRILATLGFRTDALPDDLYTEILGPELPTWIAPTFVNSWENEEGRVPAGYYKDALGIVHVRMNVTGPGPGGTAPTVFTLPVGYRPGGGQRQFAALDDSGLVQVASVNTNGAVSASTANASAFRAEFSFLAEG